jgi:hypothetical protein
MAKRTIWVAWGLVLASAVGALVGGCYQRRRSQRFLLPDGYVGWFEVRYGVQSAPALPVQDGFDLVRVPKNGLVETSTPIEFGWADDEYYYLSGSQQRRLKEWSGKDDDEIVQFGSTSGRGPNGTLRQFIGTRQEFERLQDRAVGPINPLKPSFDAHRHGAMRVKRSERRR